MSKNNFFSSFAPYLAGAVGSGVANQFSALSPFSAAIGAGAGALTNSNNRLAGAAQGFAGGGVGSAVAGGVKGAFGGNGGNFGSGAMNGLQQFGSSIPGFGGIGTNNPTGAFAKFFSPNSGQSAAGFSPSSGAGSSFNTNLPNSGTPLSNAFPMTGAGFAGPSTGVSTGATGAPAGGFGGGLSTGTTAGFGSGSSASTGGFGSAAAASNGNSTNPMDMFKKMLPGIGVAGLGSLLAPTPAAPDYSGVKNNLTQQGQQAFASQQPAMDQYLKTLSQTPGASAESGVANARLIADRQKQEAARQIQQQFAANNGDTTGNSAYNEALTKSNSYYDQNYAAQAAQTQFEYDQAQKTQQTAAAQALQGMSNEQLQYYASLANLDVQSIQDKFNLDAGSAQSLKNIAAQAGGFMMQSSLGLNGNTTKVGA